MKKTEKHTDKKKTAIICGLSALCIAVLAGAYFLTREPETDFTPASTERADMTDTWEENAGTDTSIPSAAVRESTQLQGTSSDNTQTVLSEDETGSVTSLSDSTAKEDAAQEKPETPPETTDDVTNPDRQPEYAPSVPQPSETPAESTPAGGGGTDDSHPGQVYDPVFGWIDVGNTQQDNIDSDGDINKQIGTMGGN